MPKRKEISRDKCDELEWIVDIFGTADILSAVVSDHPGSLKPFYIVRDLKEKDVVDDKGDTLILPNRILGSHVKSGNVPNGLYFDGAHWYSVKNNIQENSYKLDFQITGSAHFCQTFAVIIYLGLHKTKYKLYPGKYGINIHTALQFWIDILKDPDYKNLTNYIIGEIRTWAHDLEPKKYNSKNVKLITDGEYLNKITKKTLLDFMKYLQEYALQNAYNDCREG